MAHLELYGKTDSKLHRTIAALPEVQAELDKHMGKITSRAHAIRWGQHLDEGDAQIGYGRGDLDRYVHLVDQAAGPIEWQLSILKRAAGLPQRQGG